MSDTNETTAATSAQTQTAETSSTTQTSTTATAGNDTTASTTGSETSVGSSGSESELTKVETVVEDEFDKAKDEAEALLAEIRADIAELILKLQKAKPAHPFLTDIELGLAKSLQKLV